MKANRCRCDVVVRPRSFSRAPLDMHLQLQPVYLSIYPPISALRRFYWRGGERDPTDYGLGSYIAHTIIAIALRNFMTRVGVKVRYVIRFEWSGRWERVDCIDSSNIRTRVRTCEYYAPYDRLFIHASRSETRECWTVLERSLVLVISITIYKLSWGCFFNCRDKKAITTATYTFKNRV